MTTAPSSKKGIAVGAQATGRIRRTQAPGASRQQEHRVGWPAAAIAPKLPITEFELTDICETVAVHFYGERARATPVPYADMRAAADAKAGPYWEKLMLTLQYYDLTPLRIASAIHLQVMQMMHERIAPRARQANGQWQRSGLGPGDTELLSDTAQGKEVAVPEDLAGWTLESDGRGRYTLTENATGRTVQGTRLADLFAQARQPEKAQAEPRAGGAAARRLQRDRRRHRLELRAWLDRLEALRGSLARWAELTGQSAELAALDEKLDALARTTQQTLAALAGEDDTDSEAG